MGKYNNIDVNRVATGFTVYADRAAKNLQDEHPKLAPRQIEGFQTLLLSLNEGHIENCAFCDNLLQEVTDKKLTIAASYKGERRIVEQKEVLKTYVEKIKGREKKESFAERIGQLKAIMIPSRITTGNPVVDELKEQEIRRSLSGRLETESTTLYLSQCREGDDLFLIQAIEDAPLSFPIVKDEIVQKGQDIRVESQFPVESKELEAISVVKTQRALLFQKTYETLLDMGWDARALRPIDQTKARERIEIKNRKSSLEAHNERNNQ